jgi:hypothetical protein
VVAPQLPVGDSWSGTRAGCGTWAANPTRTAQSVYDLIATLKTQYAIDPDRVYVTGVSIGGVGSWDFAERWPNIFAATMPLSGYGDQCRIGNLKSMPVWAYHGAVDNVLNVSGTRNMINAIKAAGGNPKYTEWPTWGHSGWAEFLKSAGVMDWYYAQTKSGSPAPPPGPTPPPTPPVGSISQTGNLVSGKTFTSSAPDHPTETGHPVSNVNDKNESTRWISAPQDNASVTTDLGSSFTVNKVSILWAADTVRNYDLQVSSDNSNWFTIASGATNNSQRQLIDTTSFSGNTTGRYFRIVAKDRWNSGYGNSIWEVGVYGTAANPNPPPPGPTPPPPTPSAPGDVNGDSRVNALDLSALISRDGQNYPAADFNGDGTVGAADMAILLSKWTW